MGELGAPLNLLIGGTLIPLGILILLLKFKGIMHKHEVEHTDDHTIKGFFAILRRELEDLLKDRDIMILVLIAPLFYSIFYSTIYLNKTEFEIPVAVLDKIKPLFPANI